MKQPDYYLPKGTKIKRWGKPTVAGLGQERFPRWSEAVTTKDAYYTEQDIKPAETVTTDPKTWNIYFTVPDPNYTIIEVERRDVKKLCVCGCGGYLSRVACNQKASTTLNESPLKLL